MTLSGILLAAALAASLSLAGIYAGRAIMARLRLDEARIALAQNARYLERWHADWQRYGERAGSRNGAWPKLPLAGTSHYRFRFGAVREHLRGRYRLLAEPRMAWLGGRYLVLDQDGRIAECERDAAGREFCR
jgi:Tfp pilus assembly protein PilE